MWLLLSLQARLAFTAPDDQLSVNHERENLVVGGIAFSDFKGDIANSGPY